MPYITNRKSQSNLSGNRWSIWGREDMSVQIILALASYRLHQKGIDRPIKIVWSREESIIGHHKRHPYYLKLVGVLQRKA